MVACKYTHFDNALLLYRMFAHGDCCLKFDSQIHEGARSGHLEVVKYLVENGADVNAKTTKGGGTPLWWAKQNLEDEDPVISFLESIGALEIGPEL
jgi:Ankyrin repeats (many copies)